MTLILILECGKHIRHPDKDKITFLFNPYMDRFFRFTTPQKNGGFNLLPISQHNSTTSRTGTARKTRISDVFITKLRIYYLITSTPKKFCGFVIAERAQKFAGLRSNKKFVCPPLDITTYRTFINHVIL
jgi:hypothetical protein